MAFVVGGLPRRPRLSTPSLARTRFRILPTFPCTQRSTVRTLVPPRASVAPAQKALIFDCDGVIVESEELHRVSYNQCWASEGLGFEWSPEFYEMLQNTIGGGKEKMRWYFDKYGWPDGKPADDAASVQDRDAFIGHLHAAKTDMYKALIESGSVRARPGVLRLMDEAHARGVKLAICSAASAGAVHLVLDRLVGQERLGTFDVVMAGDVVSRKKPDPMIYNVAAQRLGVRAKDCVVIEDSQIGLAAGVAAGMKVVITHTPYTASQEFEGAAAVYGGLGEAGSEAGGEVVTVDSLFPELVGSAAAL